MDGYRELRVQTPQGDISFQLAEPWRDGGRPLVVMLHGALRNAGVLAEWNGRLEALADLAIMDLPGHGASGPPERYAVADIAAMSAAAILSAFPDRRILLVGESLGGNVALTLGGMEGDMPWRAVLAADPPMTTTKLWSVHANFRRLMAQAPPGGRLHQLGRDTFGIIEGGLEEIIYYPLLGRLNVPAVVVTGDVPLQPPRVVKRPNILFDEVDQFVVGTVYPHVEVQRMSDCGHLVLSDQPEACLAIMRRLLAEHVGAE